MADKMNVPTVVSDRALEMAMRDVLDSMCEFSLESGFKPTDGGFEIIEIYPAHRDNANTPRDAANDLDDGEEGEVIQFPDLRRAAG